MEKTIKNKKINEFVLYCTGPSGLFFVSSKELKKVDDISALGIKIKFITLFWDKLALKTNKISVLI